MRRRWPWVVLAGLALVLALGFYRIRPVLHSAGAAAEYVARRGCLCVFVSERTLPACLAEMPDMVVAVDAELLEAERAVRARLSFIAERTARFEGGSRCIVD